MMARFSIILYLLLLGSFAFGQDLWRYRSNIRSGHSQYIELRDDTTRNDTAKVRDYDYVLSDFVAAREIDSLAFISNYNVGNAYLKMYRLEEAKKYWELALKDEKATLEQQATGHYNMGTALIWEHIFSVIAQQQSGQQGGSDKIIDESIEELKEALRLHYERDQLGLQIRHNLIYAKKLKEQGVGQDNQQQQNQDQNKDQEKQQDQQDQEKKQDQQKDQKDQQDQNKEGEENKPQPRQGELSEEQMENLLKAVASENKKAKEKMDKANKKKVNGGTGKKW